MKMIRRLRLIVLR
uniref:Uncharacterized protein n=1 Tax=Rhizophora mucronata TaxID=61149 RepID=A0A2P2PMQ9_RHIMU